MNLCIFCTSWKDVRVTKDCKCVDKGDMWTFLLCLVRYAMGRRSYIVGTAPRLVLKYKEFLESSQLLQIKEEVEKEIKIHDNMGKRGDCKDWLGNQHDYDSWVKFASDLGDILKKDR